MKSRFWMVLGLVGMCSVDAAGVAGQTGGQAIDAILEGGDEESRWGALTRVLGVQDASVDLTSFTSVPDARALPGTEEAAPALPSSGGLAQLRDWMSEAVRWRPASREEVAIATGVSFALLAIVTLMLVGTVRTLRTLVTTVLTGRGRPGRAPLARGLSRRGTRRDRGRAAAPALSRDAARLEARLRARRVA